MIFLQNLGKIDWHIKEMRAPLWNEERQATVVFSPAHTHSASMFTTSKTTHLETFQEPVKRLNLNSRTWCSAIKALHQIQEAEVYDGFL